MDDEEKNVDMKATYDLSLILLNSSDMLLPTEPLTLHSTKVVFATINKKGISSSHFAWTLKTSIRQSQCLFEIQLEN